jgi:UDP-glucose 4-epimerase
MSETVLVTGGSGFIGSYVVKQLCERGDNVVIFDVRAPRDEQKWMLAPYADRFEVELGGIEDWSCFLNAVKKYPITRVVHTAAIVSLITERPLLAIDVNFMGTIHVLEAARIFNYQRVVYYSSIGALPAVQYQPIDANHPMFLANEGTTTFYGAAKVAGEAFCWAYHTSFGIDFITIRPSAVYGFGQFFPNYIKPMVENAVRGLPTHFPYGAEHPRDYTHADDLAQLTLRALDVPKEQVKDRLFYGATGEPLTTAGQVATMVKELIPGAECEIGSGLGPEDLLVIRMRGQLSIDNARQQLGYEPRFKDLREGMKDYIQNYRLYLDSAA